MRQFKTLMSMFIGVGLLAMLVACGGPGGLPDGQDGSSHGTKQQSFNGSLEFSGCIASEKAKLQQAVNRLLLQMRTYDHRLLTCLKDAFIDKDKYTSPEWLLKELRGDKGSKFSCVAGVPALRSLGISPVGPSFLAKTSVPPTSSQKSLCFSQ